MDRNFASTNADALITQKLTHEFGIKIPNYFSSRLFQGTSSNSSRENNEGRDSSE